MSYYLFSEPNNKKNPDQPNKLNQHKIEKEFLLTELAEMLSAMEPSLLEKFNDPEFQQQLKQLQDNFPANPADIDIDLDGKLSKDQIELFFNEIPSITVEPILGTFGGIPSTNLPKLKRTDEEKIMDKIHGTGPIEVKTPRRSAAKNRLPSGSIPNHKMPFAPPPGYEKFTPSRNNNTNQTPSSGNEGIFRTFGQTIITQTVRKPDGSVETRRTVRDNDGTTKTTISKMQQDGKTETITYDEGAKNVTKIPPAMSGTNNNGSGGKGMILETNQNLFLTKEGYTLPRNMW